MFDYSSRGEMDESLERAKEGKWREVAAINAAHARGEIDDDGWHRAMASLVVPAYLGASTLEGGSGHSGTPAEWEWSRGIVAEAIHRDGTFLDVGCANGLLMESVARWGRERGRAIEPYGLEIAPELARAAKARLPIWADRITACISDPETRNTRSVRAFEKAGFVTVRTVELPGETASRQVVRRERRPAINVRRPSGQTLKG